MALFGDRIKVTCSTSGTGSTLTLGSAVSGFQTLSEGGLSNGDSVRYVIEDGSNFEIGLGTYATGSPDTLTGRSDANVSASSNSNNRINLSGSSTLFIAPTAADLQTVHVYSATSDLPSASDNHGMIAHVHGLGRMVFAHGGSWINLANASEITSYTHPNHSGEVTSTGDGATVIADNVVDEANLKVSNSPTDGYVLTARSGNTGGMTWEAASGGGSGIALTDLSVTQNTASGSGTLSYDNTSGVFSYTPPASSGGGTSLSDPIKQTEFTGSATTTFSVSYTAGNINVFLNGSKLAASDFTATNGTSVVLNSACAASDVVTVVEYGAPFASQYSSTTFTVGTSSEYNTSTKVLTTDYTVGKVAVYLNGVKLIIGANNDFTATDGSSINLTSAAPVTGDTIEVVEHGTLADSVTTLTGLSDTPSSLGTAGQILQVNSGATALEFADAATGGGGGSLEATASGALANGDKVVVNSDGTVSVVASSTSSQTLGSAVQVTTSSISQTALAYDTNNQKVVVAMRKSSQIKAVVGTVSGNSISFGSEVTVAGNGRDFDITYDANAQKFAVVYKNADNSNYPEVKIGTVSGTSISFGTAVVIESTAATSKSAITYDENAQKLAVFYATTSGYLSKAVVGTISGTSVSFGTPITISSGLAGVDHQAVYHSGAQKTVMVCRNTSSNNAGYGNVFTISGTSISAGTSGNFVSSYGSWPNLAYDANAQKVVVVHVDTGSSSQGKAYVGSVSGTTLTWGSAQTYYNGSISNIPAVAYDTSAGKLVIAYRDSSNSSAGKFITGTVSGSSITFDTTQTLESNAINNPSAVYDASQGKIVFVYANTTNTDGDAKVLQVGGATTTNLTAENYIGISDGAYSDTATATIQIAGSVDDAQSGLTAGKAYYVQTDGTLSTTAGSPSVFAGTAVSATKLIVKG